MQHACCSYHLLGSADASLCDLCPWLMSMRDVMVNPGGTHADVVRDVICKFLFVRLLLHVASILMVWVVSGAYVTFLAWRKETRWFLVKWWTTHQLRGPSKPWRTQRYVNLRLRASDTLYEKGNKRRNSITPFQGIPDCNKSYKYLLSESNVDAALRIELSTQQQSVTTQSSLEVSPVLQRINH